MFFRLDASESKLDKIVRKNNYECEESRTAGLTLRELDGGTNLLNYNILWDMFTNKTGQLTVR